MVRMPLKFSVLVLLPVLQFLLFIICYRPYFLPLRPYCACACL